jgi:putative heme transporter
MKNPVRRSIASVVGVATIAFIFAVVLPKLTKSSYSEIWKLTTSLSSAWLGIIIVVGVINLLTYGPNWIVALPGLTYMQSMRVTMAGTAISNVLPLGGAISMPMQIGMFRKWGFTSAASSRAMVLTGVWNNLINFGLPIVGLTALTLRGGRNAVLETTARVGGVFFLIGIVLVISVFASDAAARKIGASFDRIRNRLRSKTPPRFSAPDTFSAFRTDSVDLLRSRWHVLTITTLLGVLTTFAVLIVLVRALHIEGVQLTTTEVFAAWSLSRLLSGIPLTPGGIGITDIGLTGALVSFGGPKDKVLAAALLYRVITTVPPIVLGALAFFGWRHETASN